jgi:hypothetical protein
MLLVWIGVKLLLPEHDEGHTNIEGSDKLWGAVKTVIVADFVMSVDNVIAIAGAAETPAAATQHGAGDLRRAGQHSHHRLGQPAGHQADGPLSDHHHRRRHAAGLDRRHHGVTDPALASADVLPHWPKLDPTDLVRYTAGGAGALLVLALGRWLA